MLSITNGLTTLGDIVNQEDKERYLLSLLEDDFRSHVVVPLYKRMGLNFLRDTHGLDEEGKDCIFTATDPLGLLTVYAIQTKKGHITMSRQATENVVEAQVQLRTALETDIILTQHHQKVKPFRVILCTSGKINTAARKHIFDNIGDPRITFFDASDLIPKIDELFPEFWFGIDADKFPYLQKLRENILSARDVITFGDNKNDGRPTSPVTDEAYIPLYLTRFTTKIVKRSGEYSQEPKVTQIQATSILNETEKLVLIIGEGGGGKTTAIRRIAYKLASDAIAKNTLSAIPVMLKASDLAASQGRLVETAGSTAAILSPDHKPSFTAIDLAQGSLVLLIDGLDEVPNDREKVLHLIQEFNVEYPKCTIVVTSRDYSYIYQTSLLKTFAHYRLSAISLHQAAKLVNTISEGRAIAKSAARNVATEMLRRLQDVHGIALTPFLVTVFATTTDFSKQDIPPNISEIFKKLTEMMLGRWDEAKSLSQQYEAPLKDFLLQRIAFILHSDLRTSMTIEECQFIFREELEKRGYHANLDILFDEVVYRSGILIIRDGLLTFRNHLLQEYFAGRGIPSPSFFESVMAEEWWRNAVVFYFGDNPDKATDLVAAATNAAVATARNQYTIAVTVGLAIQACYLSEVKTKATGLLWVLEALAQAYNNIILNHGDSSTYPMNEFLSYYLSARDAIACSQITKCSDDLVDKYNALTVKTPTDDARYFWLLVGLLESGYAEKTLNLLKGFRPSDARFQLGLHLGAFHISHLRITDKEEKKVAAQIVETLNPKVQPMIQQLWKEYRGILLELRQGKIEALENNEMVGSEETTIEL